MSYQRERDEFLSIMGAEGVSVRVSRALLRDASRLQRLAELECSSEAADRDRVKCPRVVRLIERPSNPCLCADYGSFDPTGFTAHDQHGTVPRIMVSNWRLERRVRTYCAETTGTKVTPAFKGDPRGYVLTLTVPSGRSNTWGQDGIGVPSQGFTAAQMERICR